MKAIVRIFVLLIILSQGYVFAGNKSKPGGLSGKHPYGIKGTYANPPLRENGRIDFDRLISELKDIKADVYYFLIYKKSTDWDEFKEFLPLARKAKIKVWAYLVPPSETKATGTEPFGLDFERWGIELAKLSKREPNLVAWSIDDFGYNLKFFTPEYMGKIINATRAINPKLAFLPCLYYKHINPELIKNYSQFFDGISFPYRAESVGANLKDATQVENEITKVRGMFNRTDFPIYLAIYVNPHSTLGGTTPEYVRDVINAGKKSADGIFIYMHQDPLKSVEKYQIIKEGFRNNKAKI